MSYKIMNTILPLGQTEKMFMNTLDMLAEKQDLSKSPIVEWGRNALEAGRWWYGCEKAEDKEKCVQERVTKFIDLYHSINEKGYNGSIISIFFDEDGQVHVYDGHHRLAIMKYLNMRVPVNCVISNRDPNPTMRGDFPLAETVIELNKGKSLYHPCDDLRLKGFTVWRPDSPNRLNYILKHAVGKTVLDIGCAEGYFSRELTKKGFTVTALDSNKKEMAVTRYLATINSLSLKYYVGKWREYLQNLEKDICFDNILFLSVFHHDLIKMKLPDAFAALNLFKGRAKRIFVECPLKSSDVKWLPKEEQGKWNISEDSFKKMLEDNTGMKVKDVQHGSRPMFLLGEIS